MYDTCYIMFEEDRKNEVERTEKQTLERGRFCQHTKHCTLIRTGKHRNSTNSGSPRAHPHVVGTLQFMSVVNQPSLPTPFYSVLVSVSVCMALSTVFHSINSPDNSPFSDSVLLALSLPYWSFQFYISLCKSPSALI